jgi:hypothetical protein
LKLKKYSALLFLFEFASPVLDTLFLPCYRVIFLLLHIPHFLKKSPLSPKLLLLTLKPPRPSSVTERRKSKNLQRELTQRNLLPLLILRIKMQAEK